MNPVSGRLFVTHRSKKAGQIVAHDEEDPTSTLLLLNLSVDDY